MPTRLWFEADGKGGHQYVRVKEDGGHRHRRRRHCAPADVDERLCRKHHSCLAHFPLDDWNSLVRSERALQRENHSLKGSLDGAMERAERERRRVAELRAEVEAVQRDRDCLAVRLRDERRRCGGGREEAFAWRERYERAAGVIEEKDRIIEEQRNANALQSRLLRRHGIVGW